MAIAAVAADPIFAHSLGGQRAAKCTIITCFSPLMSNHPELVEDALILVVSLVPFPTRLRLALVSTSWRAALLKSDFSDIVSSLFESGKWVPGLRLCGKPWSLQSTRSLVPSPALVGPPSLPGLTSGPYTSDRMTFSRADGSVCALDVNGPAVNRSTLRSLVANLQNGANPNFCSFFFEFMAPCESCIALRTAPLPAIGFPAKWSAPKSLFRG